MEKMESNYIYPIKSSFVDFRDGTCAVACWYADKSFEVKQYSINNITEIEIDLNNHCAFFAVDYVSYVFIVSGMSNCDLSNLADFARDHSINLILDERDYS